MPVINNPFNGKMNLDVADYRIDGNDYIDALNITKDAQGVGQDRVISNMLGNTIIPYTLPNGVNKVIGFYPDKVRNRAYYFLWNSEGYNSILYYSIDDNTIIKVFESKTDSDGIDILNFDPSYKILSVNLYYRDDEGDILFFNDGLNPPKNINILANYGTSWKAEYLTVIKAPPIMPPKVVYENEENENFTINNLRNKLFQFSYRYVYDNNEKSVWSSKSIVPLPQQPYISLTDTNFRANARISISVSTGGINIKKIELAFRETYNLGTSDWYLLAQVDKSVNSIADNDIYTYKFLNDQIYSILDVIDTLQLQDWVPQKANAAELANGNVLLYSGITEGYDKTSMTLTPASTQDVVDGYFIDQCGLLFFASCDGTDSGGKSTIMKVFLYGTGSNTNNIVSDLDNASGIYTINAINSVGESVGISYEYSVNDALVADLLTNISLALMAVGWDDGIIVDNILTITYTSVAGGVTLLSSGVAYIYTNSEFDPQPDNVTLANSWSAGYQYALQYFDSNGRTIGAQIDINSNDINGSSFNTVSYPISIPEGHEIRFPKVYLFIYNQPPLYATYYQILRSNNTTYNKRLYWISLSAYSSIYSEGSSEPRYIYINVANIENYNKQISSTTNVVSYSYVPGDRVRFLRRYDVENTGSVLDYNSVDSQYDYEIAGTEASVQYNIETPIPVKVDNNTYTAVGNFLKIKYPSNDISGNFNFTGTEDFQHYEIFIYNYSSNASRTQRAFFEFGKCFGILNPGTENRLHMGLQRSQTNSLPAQIDITNGDLFYRKRNVPYGDDYNFLSNSIKLNTVFDFDYYMSLDISVTKIINNASYEIKSQESSSVEISIDNYPQFSDDTYFFYNKSINSKIINIVGKFSANDSIGGSVFSMYALICNTSDNPKYTVSLLPSTANPLLADVTQIFDIDKKITIPPNSKVWLIAGAYGRFAVVDIILSSFEFDFNIIKNNTIDIIESSFSDTYNLVTNSNGRPSVVDENAAKRYFPTLIRFGQAYQFNTNINGTNRFYYENFDEYDRSFGDVMRLHVRDRYLKVYQQFKVGNVPILTQIVKDSANNPLQANTDTLINKIQYYAGNYGIGDAATSLAWNNFSDYFVDNYRGVVCRLSQDGITPLSIVYNTNAFFVPTLAEYRQNLNNGLPAEGVYTGNPCIYGVFDAYTNKYIIAMEEINRYAFECDFNGGSAVISPYRCDYNGGTAVPIAYECDFNGGSADLVSTFTLDWHVGNQPGGELIIFNNSMSIILDITSTGGSSQSGTIYPLIGELPYTIRGQWVSGSGNIIQFNLCDLIAGGTIYTSGEINISNVYEDYLVTSPPYYGLVNLTAQHVAPPTCPVV